MGPGGRVMIAVLVAGLCTALLASPGLQRVLGGDARGESLITSSSASLRVAARIDALVPRPADMSQPLRTAQGRCPPGQLVFLTTACGCNGACCACSAREPYLDHCSCKCSATPPTACRTGFSAGRQ